VSPDPMNSAFQTPVTGSVQRSALSYGPMLIFGMVILVFMLGMAFLAPLFAGDPLLMQPIERLKAPSAQFLFGTDNLGRDVFARTLYGARISLLVGLSVAVLSVGIGLSIGVLAGYFRGFDAIVSRLLDGVMAIPAILLAIALVTLTRGSLVPVILAIAIPEIPRVVRLVRSIVLTTREEPFVEAAIAAGTRVPNLLWRHILPSTLPALIVQASYICASAILIEASLSFLGAGVPADIPSWGNMIANSRLFLGRAPWTMFYPGLALALVVLAVNMIGDGLRDWLDPRLKAELK
jgi:peptide/nickel transport system permease protein